MNFSRIIVFFVVMIGLGFLFLKTLPMLVAVMQSTISLAMFLAVSILILYGIFRLMKWAFQPKPKD